MVENYLQGIGSSLLHVGHYFTDTQSLLKRTVTYNGFSSLNVCYFACELSLNIIALRWLDTLLSFRSDVM